jgi:hypothetical protein
MRLARILLSVLLCMPAAAQTSFMVGNEAANLPAGVYTELANQNVKYVRLAINWAKANPSPGVYNWTDIDREIKAATSAGIEVYANVMWAPAHASGGLPAYEEYLNGCTVWNITSTVTFLIGSQSAPDVSKPLNPDWARKDVYAVPRGGTITIPAPGILGNDGDHGKNAKGDPLASVVKTVAQRTPTAHGSFILYHDGSLTYTHDGSDSTEDGSRYWVWGLPDSAGGASIHFASDDYEYCTQGGVPHIDPNAVRAFTKALVGRWGHVLDYYGIWNEPGIDIYWPPRVQEGQWLPGDFERLTQEVIIPFTEAVRLFDPSAKLVGPECDSSSCINGVLSREAASGQRWFDIVSFHPYPWDFAPVGGPEFWPEAVMWRIDNDFKPSIDKYLAGREAWSTELGTEGPRGQEFMINATKGVMARPWITMMEYHNPRALFAPGTNLEAGPYSPSDLLTFLKSQQARRRRAVRHSAPNQ